MIVSKEEAKNKYDEIFYSYKYNLPKEHEIAFIYAKWYAEKVINKCAEEAKCCEDAMVDLGHTIVEAYVDKQSILKIKEEL